MNSSNFYTTLVSATAEQREQLQSLPIITDALSGHISLSQYRHFLRCAYHHVSHTVPLLMACGARLPTRLSWLLPAVAEYIEEEIGHEKWIADDLNATGADAAQVLAQPAPPSVELMLAYVYDRIARGNPASFFGMVLVLEGTSIALATRAAQSLREGLGLPKSAFRYLLSHGELDKEHMGFYEGLMNRIEEHQDQQAIISAAQMTYRLYAEVLSSAQEQDTMRRAA